MLTVCATEAERLPALLPHSRRRAVPAARAGTQLVSVDVRRRPRRLDKP